MAEFKGRLKRVIAPDVGVVAPYYGGTDRIDPFLDLWEPINGWSIRNAVIIIDFTMLCFQESEISNSGAMRCTNVVSYYHDGYGSGVDGYAKLQNYLGMVNQLDASPNANCRMWPCCTITQLMEMPYIYVENYDRSISLGLNPLAQSHLGPDPTGIRYLSLWYGASASSEIPKRFYTTIDIQLWQLDDYETPL